MIKKLAANFLLGVIMPLYALNATAQSQETIPIQKSALLDTSLPAGALKIKNEHVPAEIKQTLAKLVEAGGSKVRQGGSEVIIWMGNNYKKSNSDALTKNIVNQFQSAAWDYKVGEGREDFTLFTLTRAVPERRALIGFFVPSDDAYIFALTELMSTGQ